MTIGYAAILIILGILVLEHFHTAKSRIYFNDRT